MEFTGRKVEYPTTGTTFEYECERGCTTDWRQVMKTLIVIAVMLVACSSPPQWDLRVTTAKKTMVYDAEQRLVDSPDLVDREERHTASAGVYPDRSSCEIVVSREVANARGTKTGNVAAEYVRNPDGNSTTFYTSSWECVQVKGGK